MHVYLLVFGHTVDTGSGGIFQISNHNSQLHAGKKHLTEGAADTRSCINRSPATTSDLQENARACLLLTAALILLFFVTIVIIVIIVS